MEKIAAIFDGKNLCDDSLRDDVFSGFYEAADMKGGNSHMVGCVSVDEYDENGLYLDAVVDARWSACSNVIRIELLACPAQTDFYIHDDFFRYYERLFVEWERGMKENRVAPDSACVEFERDGNVLYVSFWWLCNYKTKQEI